MEAGVTRKRIMMKITMRTRIMRTRMKALLPVMKSMMRMKTMMRITMKTRMKKMITINLIQGMRKKKTKMKRNMDKDMAGADSRTMIISPVAAARPVAAHPVVNRLVADHLVADHLVVDHPAEAHPAGADPPAVITAAGVLLPWTGTRYAA
jgi:hypothetical protein